MAIHGDYFRKPGYRNTKRQTPGTPGVPVSGRLQTGGEISWATVNHMFINIFSKLLKNCYKIVVKNFLKIDFFTLTSEFFPENAFGIKICYLIPSDLHDEELTLISIKRSLLCGIRKNCEIRI